MEINNIQVHNDPTLLQKKVESAAKKMEDEKLKEVCKEFESIFLSTMLKEMKKTIPDDGLIEKGMATEIFEDMYIDEVSQEVSKDGDGIGIAKMLYEQFNKGYVSW